MFRYHTAMDATPTFKLKSAKMLKEFIYIRFNKDLSHGPNTRYVYVIVEYFNSGQEIGDSLVDSLKYISHCFYWRVKQTNGSTAINVTVGYDTSNCSVYAFDDMRIAQWDGNLWKDLGQGSIWPGGTFPPRNPKPLRCETVEKGPHSSALAPIESAARSRSISFRTQCRISQAKTGGRS